MGQDWSPNAEAAAHYKGDEMLFHVKATHSEDNCPMYRQELMPAMLEAMSSGEDSAKEAGVNVLFSVVDTPAHVIYALVEAESVAAISRWLFSFPVRQHADIRAVEDMEDVVERARAMMEASK